MTLRRLRRLVAAYGANPARWPANQRTEAERLIATSAEAREILEDAQAVDAALARAAVPIDALTLDRLRDGIARRVARLPAASDSRPTAWLGGLLGTPLRWGTLVAAAVVGIWIGWSEPLLQRADPLAVLPLDPIAGEAL